MVNHFASLLGNFNLYRIDEVKTYYQLATETDQSIIDELFEVFLTDEYEILPKKVRINNALVNRDYAQIALPMPLKAIYDILFPPSASLYYKQFLLYCYLRLVGATDRLDETFRYDSRISYNLDELAEYFRLTRSTAIKSSHSIFQLLLAGTYSTDEGINNYYNQFTVQQINATKNITIYSNTQNRYYAPGLLPTTNISAATIELHAANLEQTLSKPIAIGDTGLSFSLAGPLDSFMSSADKQWTFSVEAPFKFNFKELYEELIRNYRKVTEMFDWKRNDSSPQYEKLWQTHYNDVYRFVGLLLAYVEKVNMLWETKQI